MAQHVGLVLGLLQLLVGAALGRVQDREPGVDEPGEGEDRLHRRPAGRVAAARLRGFGPQGGDLGDLRGEPFRAVPQPGQPVLGVLHVEPQAR